MKGAKYALVDEAEVVVAALDDGRLGLVPDTFHHDGVSLKCIACKLFSGLDASK